MKTNIVLTATSIFLFAALSCKKDGKDNDTSPVHSTVDTVGRMILVPYNYAEGYDTTDNYIATYYFGKHTAYSTIAQYVASNSSGTHYMRYVGAEPLFHPDSAFDRGGWIVEFRINPNLKGKPIFEAYEISTNKLFKTYIASKDSVKIDCEFSIWDNYFVTNRRIGEAMLYYINTKQTDKIRYRKSN